MKIADKTTLKLTDLKLTLSTLGTRSTLGTIKNNQN